MCISNQEGACKPSTPPVTPPVTVQDCSANICFLLDGSSEQGQAHVNSRQQPALRVEPAVAWGPPKLPNFCSTLFCSTLPSLSPSLSPTPTLLPPPLRQNR